MMMMFAFHDDRSMLIGGEQFLNTRNKLARRSAAAISKATLKVNGAERVSRDIGEVIKILRRLRYKRNWSQQDRQTVFAVRSGFQNVRSWLLTQKKTP